MKDNLYSHLARRGIEIDMFSENDPDFNYRGLARIAAFIVPLFALYGWWQIYMLFFG